MNVKKQFSQLFKVGQIIESGAGADRKNAANLKILAIEDDLVRYRSIQCVTVHRVRYAYLQKLVDGFMSLDPKSIQKSVRKVLRQRGFRPDYSNKTQAYSFAKAFRERAGLDPRAGIPSRGDDVEGSVPSTVQGFMSSPAVRRSIENHAVDLAIKHFKAHGYVVQIHGKPFDLHCTRGKEKLYVEVKGTQGSGGEILLTKGEVKFNRNKLNRMALFVASGVQISPEGKASGGKSIIIKPWTIRDKFLTPYAFTYIVRQTAGQ